MLRIKWLWLLPNLMQFLSIFLKLQAVKQIGPGFLAYPVFFQLLSDQRGELTYNLRKRALAINAKKTLKTSPGSTEDRQRAWFSRISLHPARGPIGSIFWTPYPSRDRSWWTLSVFAELKSSGESPGQYNTPYSVLILIFILILLKFFFAKRS